MHLSVYKNKKGFSLTELMVVIAIITAITSALILQQNKWNDRLALDTQTYELALMLRQAQVYSLGVRQYVGASGDPFNVGYGVCADSSNTGSYIFFVDKNNDGKCGVGETIETKNLTRGVYMSKICGTNNLLAERCSPDVGNIQSIHISFLRPSPAPRIALLNNGGNNSSSVGTPAYIYLTSASNTSFKVKLDSTGQISIIK